jgi:hypothetical protein
MQTCILSDKFISPNKCLLPVRQGGRLFDIAIQVLLTLTITQEFPEAGSDHGE